MENMHNLSNEELALLNEISGTVIQETATAFIEIMTKLQASSVISCAPSNLQPVLRATQILSTLTLLSARISQLDYATAQWLVAQVAALQNRDLAGESKTVSLVDLTFLLVPFAGAKKTEKETRS